MPPLSSLVLYSSTALSAFVAIRTGDTVLALTVGFLAGIFAAIDSANWARNRRAR